MTSKVHAIFGASGFGREVMPLARLAQQRWDHLFFVDDAALVDVVNGVNVLTYQDFLALSGVEKSITIAIADDKVRRMLTERCEADGIYIESVFASNSVVLDEVVIKPGAVMCPFTTITSNVIVGKSFHMNIYSYVAHDCVIGDYVTFAPGVKCNGNVIVEDGAYVGTGAIIKQGRPGKPIVIGKNAVVGMGAVVTKSVPEGAVVVGNPARPLSRKGLGG